MKRKLLSHQTVAYSFTRSKKPKLFESPLPGRGYNIKWISATKTRNFLLNDSLVDWLKVHGSSSKIGVKNTNRFMSFIMEKGIQFEDALIKYIHKNKTPIVTVSEYITDESVSKTISLMKNGTPVIHSAPVRNNNNKTHGIIDLLVRSDYLDKIIDDCPISDEEKKIPSKKLGKNYHYVVIDIKFSTLPLKADGRHLLNSGSYPAYKAQCLIYNQAIANIQGYTPRYSFILGRRWKYMSKEIKHNNYTCLNRLGVIDYEKNDQIYVGKTKEALSWIRDIDKNGHKWSTSPPCRSELYPNMCFDSGKWQKQKNKIAKDIGEISSMWYCGIKHREKAIKKGIKTWKDPKCTSNNMGMKGERASIIDKILDINRQSKDLIRPNKIKNNVCNWKKKCNEVFVDFETLSDIFDGFEDLPHQKTTDMIFMIGVWYKPKNSSKWEYKRFTCNKKNLTEEYRIMDEFNQFIKSQNNPKLWYWCAENRFWKRSQNRHYENAINSENEEKATNISNKWNLNKWSDLCEIFKHEPIVIKDCFKFGLKPISSAMRSHGLIKTKIESECSSGMTAMVKAYKCYQEFDNPANCPIMRDIAKYNEFDCHVLEEIITYLRNNHT